MDFRTADNAIFNAFCGGLILSIWTGIQAALLLLTAHADDLWLAILSLSNVVIFGVLTYGIHHKSRVCAVLIFPLFLFYQITALLQHINLWGVIALIGLSITFVQGIIGTYTYQRVRQQQLTNNAN